LFKLIGVIAGYYFFGFFRRAARPFAGHISTGCVRMAPARSTPLQNALRQAVFLDTVFIAMASWQGRRACLQGEIDHVELFMHKLGMKGASPAGDRHVQSAEPIRRSTSSDHREIHGCLRAHEHLKQVLVFT